MEISEDEIKMNHIHERKLFLQLLWKQVRILISDPGIPGVRSKVRVSKTPRPFADLTDVTLADEDSNSILADDTNRTIPGNLKFK